MTNHANGSSMPQIGNLTTATDLKASAAFNEAVLKGAAMVGKPSYVEVDYALYEGMLDDPAMSKADKRLLIDTLWGVVTSFVELGFGVHPVQQAQEARDMQPASQTEPMLKDASLAECGKGQNVLAIEEPDSVSSQDKDNAPKTAEGGPE